MSSYPRHFDFRHLPIQLQAVSKPFADLAQLVLETLPDGHQRLTCLQKLLEAKDCAVRAKLDDMAQYIGDAAS